MTRSQRASTTSCQTGQGRLPRLALWCVLLAPMVATTLSNSVQAQQPTQTPVKTGQAATKGTTSSKKAASPSAKDHVLRGVYFVDQANGKVSFQEVPSCRVLELVLPTLQDFATTTENPEIVVVGKVVNARLRATLIMRAADAPTDAAKEIQSLAQKCTKPSPKPTQPAGSRAASSVAEAAADVTVSGTLISGGTSAVVMRASETGIYYFLDISGSVWRSVSRTKLPSGGTQTATMEVAPAGGYMTVYRPESNVSVTGTLKGSVPINDSLAEVLLRNVRFDGGTDELVTVLKNEKRIKLIVVKSITKL